MKLDLEPAKGGDKETLEADVVLVSAGETAWGHASALHAPCSISSTRTPRTRCGSTHRLIRSSPLAAELQWPKLLVYTGFTTKRPRTLFSELLQHRRSCRSACAA